MELMLQDHLTFLLKKTSGYYPGLAISASLLSPLSDLVMTLNLIIMRLQVEIT